MPDRQPTRGARLNELDDEFIEYANKNGMSQAEAIRTLVREGLRDDEDEDGESESRSTEVWSSRLLGLSFTFAMMTIWLALVTAAAAVLAPSLAPFAFVSAAFALLVSTLPVGLVLAGFDGRIATWADTLTAQPVDTEGV